MYDHDLNRRALENLIRCGSFDSMKVRRSQLLAVMNPVMDGIAAAARKRNLRGSSICSAALEMRTTAPRRRSCCPIFRSSARRSG